MRYCMPMGGWVGGWVGGCVGRTFLQPLSKLFGRVHQPVDGLIEEVFDAGTHTGHEINRRTEGRERASNRKDLRECLGGWVSWVG